MKILVIGRTGQIGAELCQLLARDRVPYIAPTPDEVDITKPESIERILALYRPQFVVNTAGYRSPSRANIEPSLCFQLNRDAVAHLAKACHRHGIVLLQISSWRVFPAKSKQSSHTEQDTPMPIDVLGSSFWQGEQQVRQFCPKHIILRLSWVMSFRSRNRFTIYIHCMRNKEVLPTYKERFGNPTTAVDVAHVILAICRQLSCGAKAWGTYHYSADGIVSETFLAETIRAEACKVQPENEWVAIYPDNKTDTRPRQYACLDSSLLRDTFGIHPRGWRESIAYLVHAHLHHISEINPS